MAIRYTGDIRLRSIIRYGTSTIVNMFIYKSELYKPMNEQLTTLYSFSQNNYDKRFANQTRPIFVLCDAEGTIRQTVSGIVDHKSTPRVCSRANHSHHTSMHPDYWTLISAAVHACHTPQALLLSGRRAGPFTYIYIYTHNVGSLSLLMCV